MLKACAVIGAQYGDEGKGLCVDWLAHDHLDWGLSVVVVRSNGGAQAAHTVVTPEGMRHVFSHWGSGTFARARTHFSRYMICNPITFLQERQTLIDVHCINPPQVTADPDSMVSIPFDSLINQAVETHRSLNRHGSCGLGIGETVERHEHPAGFPVRLRDLSSLTVERLREIREQWVWARLEALGVTDIPEPYRDLLTNDAISERFVRDCAEFLSLIEIVPDEQIASLADMVIFEGAQGLALDQTMGAFPYVTRSNTGLKNIIDLAVLAGIEAIEVYYMTRCYTTRHGAGPLPREQLWSPGAIEVVDPTNIPNPWQGSLRVAPLDLFRLRKRLWADLSMDPRGIEISPSLVVTCLDQVKGDLDFYAGMTNVKISPEKAAEMITEYIDLPIIESWGPTRATIRCPEVVDQGLG